MVDEEDEEEHWATGSAKLTDKAAVAGVGGGAVESEEEVMLLL